MRENRKHIWLDTFRSFAYEICLGEVIVLVKMRIKFDKNVVKISSASIKITYEGKCLIISEDGFDDEAFTRAGIRITDDILKEVDEYIEMLKSLTVF